MRMFVAVRPAQEVLDDLDQFLEPRRAADHDLRWTDPDQWHLTLAFLPQVHEDRLDELVERLGDAARKQPPFQLRVRGGGAFPHAARAKVLWMGVPDDAGAVLGRLATRSRHAAVASGSVVDGSRFHPHLTVARVPRGTEATRWLRILGSYDGPTWTARQLTLVESHLGEGRHRHARHEVRATLPLGRAAECS
jgi:2'-5' RNA ligase